MSDEVWYYADGERQKGPVSANDLKEFVEQGRIKPTDLVWQPGMDDWVKANSIRGLVRDDLQEIPLEHLGQATIDAGFDGDVPRIRRRRRRSPFLGSSEGLEQWGQRHGKLLLLAGLLLVVLARGCDSLGAKYAKRQQVLVDVAQAELDAGFRQRRTRVQAKLSALQGQPALSDRDQQQVIDFQQELIQLDRERTDRQNELMQSTWLDLEIASRVSASNHVAWQPLYELLELVGSVVLTIGLLVVAFTGASIERWGCWILLGVFLLHVYFENGPAQL